MRFDQSEKQRLDALRMKLLRRALDKTISRAAVVRLLVRMALDMVDAASGANDNAGGILVSSASLSTILDTKGTPEVRGKPWKKRVPFASRPEAKRVDHSTTQVDLQRSGVDASAGPLGCLREGCPFALSGGTGSPIVKIRLQFRRCTKRGMSLAEPLALVCNPRAETPMSDLDRATTTFRGTLRRGASGPEVRQIQEL